MGLTALVTAPVLLSGSHGVQLPQPASAQSQATQQPSSGLSEASADQANHPVQPVTPSILPEEALAPAFSEPVAEMPVADLPERTSLPPTVEVGAMPDDFLPQSAPLVTEMPLPQFSPLPTYAPTSAAPIVTDDPTSTPTFFVADAIEDVVAEPAAPPSEQLSIAASVNRRPQLSSANAPATPPLPSVQETVAISANIPLAAVDTLQNERTQPSLSDSPAGESAAGSAVELGSSGGGHLQSHVYVVRPGDSLPQIAKRLGIPLKALLQSNNMDPAGALLAGQTLQLPDAAAIEAALPTAASTSLEVPATVGSIGGDEYGYQPRSGAANPLAGLPQGTQIVAN